MKKHLLGFFLLFTSALLFGQVEAPPLDNSPYSRLGLGDLNNQNFAVPASMGNLSASFQDAYHLNLLNPAASASLKSTSYELGLTYRRTTMTDNKSNSATANNGNVGYLAIGFPLRNQVNELLDKRKKSDISHGMTFGLVPYSSVGYNIKVVRKINVVDTVNYNYKGTGGTYKLYWGNSLAYKNWSFGVNLGYLFGRIKSDRSITFPKLTDNYDDNFTSTTVYRGVLWSLGTQYTYEFKKKNDKGKIENSGDKLIFGIFGNSGNSFNTVTDATYARYNRAYVISQVTGQTSIDTLLKDRSSQVKAKGSLPSELSLGLTYQKGTKLRIGANYSLANWSNYTNPAKVETLKNASTFGIGLEYTPEANSYNKYSRRIRYRFGVNSWNDPRSVNGEQLSGKNVTIGFGLPLIIPRQQVSFVNIGFEVGQFGASALQQNYFKTTLGFTFNDNSWFYKRRFN